MSTANESRPRLFSPGRRKRSASGPTKPISPIKHPSSEYKTQTYGHLLNAFKVGSKIEIYKDEQHVRDFFSRSGLNWDRKYKAYLGTSATIKSVGVDGNLVLEMHDGKDLFFAGVAKLVHSEDFEEEEDEEASSSGTTNESTDEKDDQVSDLSSVIINYREKELKKCLVDGRRVNFDLDSIFRDKSCPAKSTPNNESPRTFRRGERVSASFKDKVPQGKVIGANHDRAPSYEVYLEDTGMRNHSHSYELQNNISHQSNDLLELRKFLEVFNLQAHYKALIAEGFESVSDLDNAQIEDLTAVGLKRGHARRLMRALEESRADPEAFLDEISQRLRRSPILTSPHNSHRSVNSTSESLSQPYSESWRPTNQMYSPQLNFQPAMPVSTISISPEILTPKKLPLPSNFPRLPRSPFNQVISPMYANLDLGPPACQQHPMMRRTRKTSVWEDDGYITIQFAQRPIGFDIMSPLFTGTMVSTISDEWLKEKGLGLGLPLLKVNNVDISKCKLNEVANALSRVQLPFSITFSLQPYFKADMKVVVLFNGSWHPATVVKMSKTTRKVTVMYDNSPFLYSNTENIADYNRIRQPEHLQGVENNHTKQVAQKTDAEHSGRRRRNTYAPSSGISSHQDYSAAYGWQEVYRSDIRQTNVLPSDVDYWSIPLPKSRNRVYSQPKQFYVKQDSSKKSAQKEDLGQLSPNDPEHRVREHKNHTHVKEKTYLTEEHSAMIREMPQGSKDNDFNES